MELNQLFKVQEAVEAHIKSISSIDEDLLGIDNIFELRFLALQVKTSEIANLTKCYKYSRVKENLQMDKLFTRYLEALGFLLSIGNVHSFNFIELEAVYSHHKEDSIIKIFSKIFDDITALKYSLQQDDFYSSLTNYIRLFALYLQLAEELEINFEEIYDYYLNRYSIK